MKNPARYSINYGLHGCYLPDSYFGAYECRTRRELCNLIRDSLAFYEMPKNLFSEVNITRLWGFIKSHGSSSAHFQLVRNGFCLSFSGLTEDEFNKENKE